MLAIIYNRYLTNILKMNKLLFFITSLIFNIKIDDLFEYYNKSIKNLHLNLFNF